MNDATHDDATLTITVTPEGITQLRVDGELVGFLEEICISPLTHPAPNVRVRFISTARLEPCEEKSKLLEQIHHFRELLSRCPQVLLLEEVETLPYMMAVRPSSIPPRDLSPKDG